MENNNKPVSLFQEWLRFIFIQVFAALALYCVLVWNWQLEHPHQLGKRYVQTALQWHAAAVEVFFLDRNLSAAHWWRLAKIIYAYDFNSLRWFIGLYFCVVFGAILAFAYDYVTFWRTGNENVTVRKWIFSGFAIALLVSAASLCCGDWLGREAGIGSWFWSLGLSTLGLIFIAAPVIWIVRRVVKPARPGEGMSDVREVAVRLQARKPFDPWDYIQPRKGCFIGLDDNRKPVYIPWSTLNSTHVDFMGMTGTGKGVGSALILGQCALVGQAVIAFDPKGDRFMPGVLKQVADQAGVPFRLIDLGYDHPPQVNLFQGASADEAYELLVAGFNLKPQGNNSDIYKIEEQICAQQVAQLANEQPLSLPGILQQFEPNIEEARTASRKADVRGRKFWMDLGTLWTLQATQTSQGPDLDQCVNTPGITYIIGSLSDLRSVQAQKMLLFRFMQIIAADRSRTSHVCMMLDELKYLLSPQVLTLLSTVRDRNCHLILAHQSLGDLAATDPTELDGRAVRGAVVENTGLKLIYRVNSPETAKWAAELSGKITAYTANEQMRAKLLENPGSWRETQRSLIEENTLLQLPKGLGVIYGIDGPARIVQICPLPAGSPPPLSYCFPIEEPAITYNQTPVPPLTRLAEAVEAESAKPASWDTPAEIPHPQPDQNPSDEELI